MLSQNDLDWYAARLAIAVYDTNREYRMGIHDLKEALRPIIPDIDGLTMQYKDGGRTQVFTLGDRTAELPGHATYGEIAAALKKKLQIRPLNIQSAQR